jgi:hypothetical protein
MDSEELLKGLLDRLISHCRQVDAWDKYVEAFAGRADEISDHQGLSEEQMAAMMFWRFHGLEVDQDEGVSNTFDDGVEDEGGFIIAFADWLVSFEAEELRGFLEEGTFASMADMLLGIYHVDLEAGGQTCTVTVDSSGVVNKELKTLYPLSDAEVDAILLQRRGYGIGN